MSASRSVQLLETELSLSPMLDYGIVYHQTCRVWEKVVDTLNEHDDDDDVTLCRGFGQNLKHFSLDSLIPLFCLSFFPSWSLRFLPRNAL